MTLSEVFTIVAFVLLVASFLYLIISNKLNIDNLEQKVETLEKNLLDLINKENNDD